MGVQRIVLISAQVKADWGPRIRNTYCHKEFSNKTVLFISLSPNDNAK